MRGVSTDKQARCARGKPRRTRDWTRNEKQDSRLGAQNKQGVRCDPQLGKTKDKQVKRKKC